MSRNYWLISDTHFLHNNIIRYCDRPFNNVDDMTEVLIDRWNSVVKKGDYVYHLGDFFMEKPRSSEEKDKRAWILQRLQGRITLILGNHDDVSYLTSTNRFHEITLWKPWNTNIGKQPMLFSHVPVHQNAIMFEHPDALNIHGHTHNWGSPKGPYKSVCVELTNYTPVNLEEI